MVAVLHQLQVERADAELVAAPVVDVAPGCQWYSAQEERDAVRSLPAINTVTTRIDRTTPIPAIINRSHIDVLPKLDLVPLYHVTPKPMAAMSMRQKTPHANFSALDMYFT